MTRTGLTQSEVAERVAAGRTNAAHAPTSRSIAQIARANILTPFNALLATLFVIILVTGRWQNALFGGVILANSAIGIFQEVRAKRTLDRLAVLTAPHAQVIREGVESEIAIAELVADDLVVLRSGDQVPADGEVVSSEGLECDESLLTGESDPVARQVGEEVRSGAIVVAGSGAFVATGVGFESYAARLAAEARRFQVTHSELVHGTNRLLRWISLMMLVVGPILLWSQFQSDDNDNWQDAVTGTTAALVGMVPEGLVLLTSLAFMLGTITLARRKTLVQELPAVEGLARVDIVCLDKTGTLTHGDVEFDRIESLVDVPLSDVREALALLTRTEAPNATSAAIAETLPVGTWTQTAAVPFSSARKWSATVTEGHGSWVLGAPEMILPVPRADEIAALGQRVLLLARSATAPVGEGLPDGLHAVALVVLAERIRSDASETMRYFTREGVTLKVISGDNPRTVGAVAAAVGVPGVDRAEDAYDARELPEDIDALADVLESRSAFGRVTPQQKRAMVKALQSRGHVVAMTGDGVNDALALKDADIGIAMGNGAPATRAVAQLVLLDSKFAHLPDVVAEGRRVIANIERAANLFIVKNAYSLLLAITTAITVAAYPLAPIQLTLISDLTIGIPGVFLALGPNHRRYVPGFLRRVLRFAVPVGLVVAVVAYVAYLLARALDHTVPAAVDASAKVEGARTSATIAVLITGLAVLLTLARPLAGWKLGLVAAMASVAALVVLIEPLGHHVFLFELTWPRLVIGAVCGAAGAVVVFAIARFVRDRGTDHGSGGHPSSPDGTTSREALPA